MVQVRTGTSKSTKGHRDPALTWEVPAPLLEAGSGSVHQVTCISLITVEPCPSTYHASTALCYTLPP